MKQQDRWEQKARNPQSSFQIGRFIELEQVWTDSYIFENEWQSFRTRSERALELTTIAHTYDKPGRYTVAVKVIDILGSNTMTLVPVTVG